MVRIGGGVCVPGQWPHQVGERVDQHTSRYQCQTCFVSVEDLVASHGCPDGGEKEATEDESCEEGDDEHGEHHAPGAGERRSVPYSATSKEPRAARGRGKRGRTTTSSVYVSTPGISVGGSIVRRLCHTCPYMTMLVISFIFAS